MPEDYYANIPCIFHSDVNNEKLLNESVQALRNLVDNLIRRSKREVISATFAWNMEDKEVRLSMLGHVSDLKKWLDSFGTIPVERKSFKNWLDQQANHIKHNGVESKCPVLSSIVYTDGVLYMKRRLVQKDVNLTFPDKNDPMVCEIEYEKSQIDLQNSVTKGEIYIAPNIVIEKMLCLKSGQDYLESPYSIVLDNDASQKIEKCRLVNFHWTDKPRPISFA